MCSGLLLRHFKPLVLLSVYKGRESHTDRWACGKNPKPLASALCRRPHPIGWVEMHLAAMATASLETKSRSSCPRGRPRTLPPPFPRCVPSLFSCLSGIGNGWEGKTETQNQSSRKDDCLALRQNCPGSEASWGRSLWSASSSSSLLAPSPLHHQNSCCCVDVDSWGSASAST